MLKVLADREEIMRRFNGIRLYVLSPGSKETVLGITPHNLLRIWQPHLLAHRCDVRRPAPRPEELCELVMYFTACDGQFDPPVAEALAQIPAELLPSAAGMLIAQEPLRMEEVHTEFGVAMMAVATVTLFTK